MSQNLINCSTCSARSSSIFCHLAGDELQGLNDHKSIKKFSRGNTIFREGDEAGGIYCLQSGNVKLYRSGSVGREVIFGIAKAGDVLGFRSVLFNEPHHQSAQVLEDTEVCIVEKTYFEKLIHSNCDVAFDVMKRIGHDLEHTEKRVSELLNIDTKTRLIRLLLMLQRTHGVEDRPGTTIGLRLTRRELGEMVGAATETVIRILSELERDRLVELDGRKIRIMNISELVNQASIEL